MCSIITIEKIVHGGAGLARTDEGTVLVPGTLPGERVKAIPLYRKNGMMVMEASAITEISRHRREPPCIHGRECGGCDWLFIDYEYQKKIKREIFLESMLRIGRLQGFPGPETLSSAEFGYRRRAQFKVDGDGRIGFFKRKTNDVVPVGRCPLLSGRLNAVLARISEDPGLLPERLRSLPLIEGDNAVVSDPVLPDVTGESAILSCGPHAFEIRGNDFFQSNRFLLERLAAAVSDAGQGKTIVDLYGGTGFFSVTLGSCFERGWLIESSEEMVRRAHTNFRRNGIHHILPVAAGVESMERFIKQPVDVVIVDPPRPGLTRAAREALVRIAPRSIVYVSCNCATQARDCGFFVNGSGYRITSSTLLDLYPNTHHTESVVTLRKDTP